MHSFPNKFDVNVIERTTHTVLRTIFIWVLEFLKFVKHQEDCRKKWQNVEEENHEMKKFMAKYKVSFDHTKNV